MEQVDIASMDAVAVMNHREMPEALGVKAIDGAHHVRGIKRMNEMRHDAVDLFPRVDPPRLILFMYDERAIRAADAYLLRLEHFMNHNKTRRDGPNHATIVLCENTGNVAEPVHDLAGLDGDFRNAFLQDFRQILGNLFRIFAVLHRRRLEELLVDRSARDTVGHRHGRGFDDRTINQFNQLPGGISMGTPTGSVYLDTSVDAIRHSHVNIRRVLAGP